MTDDDALIKIEAIYTEAEIRELAQDYGVDPDKAVENVAGTRRGIEEAAYGWISDAVHGAVQNAS